MILLITSRFFHSGTGGRISDKVFHGMCLWISVTVLRVLSQIGMKSVYLLTLFFISTAMALLDLLLSSFSLACESTIYTVSFSILRFLNNLLQQYHEIHLPVFVVPGSTEFCFKHFRGNIALKSEILEIITQAQHVSHVIRASTLGLDNSAQLCTEHYAIRC